ncbi:hypothetical protein [Bacteroides sp. ET225]|uniref:hypothetical protein n=1 Tax=Bacteroides sp. ET225 TaxID=2972461 RepID=UPI0021ACAD71|nr:hypothetical protein [Bacteroides sp. ET225]MCR8919249.1 hypothetical protein [Bacteroides sp. ET225]
MMKPTGKLKTAIMAAVIILACSTADAQRWRWHSRPYRVVTAVAKPDIIIHVDNRFSQKERFRMAMAYLKSHEYLTVKRYAKMTELSKAAAKAELDAFVADKEKPIMAVIRGEKKVYTLKK